MHTVAATNSSDCGLKKVNSGNASQRQEIGVHDTSGELPRRDAAGSWRCGSPRIGPGVLGGTTASVWRAHEHSPVPQHEA